MLKSTPIKRKKGLVLFSSVRKTVVCELTFIVFYAVSLSVGLPADRVFLEELATACTAALVSATLAILCTDWLFHKSSSVS